MCDEAACSSDNLKGQEDDPVARVKGQEDDPVAKVKGQEGAPAIEPCKVVQETVHTKTQRYNSEDDTYQIYYQTNNVYKFMVGTATPPPPPHTHTHTKKA